MDALPRRVTTAGLQKVAVPWVLAALLMAGASACRPERPQVPPYVPHWAEIDARPTPRWFTDARFGIFIHWGVYSVPAWGVPGEYAEWYWYKSREQLPDNPWRAFHSRTFGPDFDYMDFAPSFRAELFDPAAWAQLFEASGARYVVLTTKHHDGFALWKSAEANRAWGRPWNAVDVGPHRDLVADVATAVRARGLRFGIYYSLSEWFHPRMKDDVRYVAEHMMPQFKDIVMRTDPSLIFADGEGNFTARNWRSEELLDWTFREARSRDELIVNDRWGNDTRHKHGGYYTTEYAAGLQDGSHAWEESRGMAYSYGYNRAEKLTDYRTARELVLNLVDLVSRGGNLLLNVGPAADGTVPLIMQQRLLQMGAWLKVNGEAIYGSRPAGRSGQWSAGKVPGQKYGEAMVPYQLMEQVGLVPKGEVAVKQAFFTQNGNTLYAVLPDWPQGSVELRGVVADGPLRVSLLGGPDALVFHQQGTAVQVEFPAAPPDGALETRVVTLKLDNAHVTP
jgi:alpha-L-fucosidase